MCAVNVDFQAIDLFCPSYMGERSKNRKEKLTPRNKNSEQLISKLGSPERDSWVKAGSKFPLVSPVLLEPSKVWPWRGAAWDELWLQREGRGEQVPHPLSSSTLCPASANQKPERGKTRVMEAEVCTGLVSHCSLPQIRTR